MKSATLDSDIYVSAFQYGGIGARLVGMARAGMFRLDVSDAIIDETVGVLRDKFVWDGYRLQDLREKIRGIANVVVPLETIEAVKDDPDDNRIVECACAAGSDLLRLGQYGDLRILNASKFLDDELTQ